MTGVGARLSPTATPPQLAANRPTTSSEGGDHRRHARSTYPRHPPDKELAQGCICASPKDHMNGRDCTEVWPSLGPSRARSVPESAPPPPANAVASLHLRCERRTRLPPRQSNQRPRIAPAAVVPRGLCPVTPLTAAAGGAVR
jgi:hypothetical protein